ncbi:MAG: hypothetical protein JO297_12015, partial [Nitrososphaeraceae archaeon]|nr:hypothetical protein [Nitrososphaeraceae archaeon]
MLRVKVCQIGKYNAACFNKKCEDTFISMQNYLKIRGIAEQIVYGLIAEQGVLLTSTIMAVVQALKVNPD